MMPEDVLHITGIRSAALISECILQIFQVHYLSYKLFESVICPASKFGMCPTNYSCPESVLHSRLEFVKLFKFGIRPTNCSSA